MATLEIEGLSVRYGRLQAVRDVSLRVEEGAVVVVLGSNGAGKSSTLNAVSGVVKAASGTVRFDGRDISGWPAHRVARSGLMQVPEGRRIIAPLTVEENLLLGAYNVRSRARRDELLAEVFAMFPVLEERRGGVGGLLSGGEQQMLAFGRALMSEPRALLLDEPSMGLAPIVVEKIMDAVAAIAERGISILMVEQNAAAAFRVAASAYVLEQGAVIVSGPVEDVREDPLVLRAFLGTELTTGQG